MISLLTLVVLSTLLSREEGARQDDRWMELAGMAVAQLQERMGAGAAHLVLDLVPVDGVDPDVHLRRVQRLAQVAGIPARPFPEVTGCGAEGDAPVDCRPPDLAWNLLRIGRLDTVGERRVLGMTNFVPSVSGQGYYLCNFAAVFQRDGEGRWTLGDWLQGACT